MKLALNGPELEPFRRGHDLRVVVAHEDVHCAMQARSLLERVGECSAVKGRLIISMWKFNVLTVPSLHRTAGKEAAEADLIVIAAWERDALPDGVLKWINRWRSSKRNRPKALVAIVEPPETKPGGEPQARSADSIRSYLEMVARFDHMDFFSIEGGQEAGIEFRVREEEDVVTQGKTRKGSALRLESSRPPDAPPAQGPYLQL